MLVLHDVCAYIIKGCFLCVIFTSVLADDKAKYIQIEMDLKSNEDTTT